jgi:hypothetical membrane protein
MLNQTRSNYLKIGSALGIVTPIVAFTCIIIAIESYPAFSWTNNALSDLGVISGLTGSLFNFGLFASGFLGLIFSIFGLANYFIKSLVGKVGSGFFAAATVALMAIGVFNERFSPTHYVVSVAFFTLAPFALFTIAGAFWLNRRRKMAAFTVIVAVLAALPWLLLFAFDYVPNVAIPEAASGLALSAWTILLGKIMVKS